MPRMRSAMRSQACALASSSARSLAAEIVRAISRAFLGELPILFYGPVLLEPGAHRHDDARMAVLFLPESGSGHRPPRAFPHMTTAIPVRAVSGMLLLIGQAVPFLSHLE